MPRFQLSEDEKRLRKLSQQRRPRVAKSDLVPGAKFCIMCKDLPRATWWRGARQWTFACDCMHQPIATETHAAAVEEWNKRQWRFE